MQIIQSHPRVWVDGLDLPESLALTDVRVVQCLDAPTQCELSWHLATARTATLEGVTLTPGNAITVTLEDQSQTLFNGEITAVEHQHEPAGGLTLRVRAYDALVSLQRQQTLDTHVEVTTAELVRTLAGEAGIEAACRVDGPVWPRVIPRFPHDLAMLRHYSARSGMHFCLHDGAVALFASGDIEAPERELTLGDDLFEARVERNAIQPVTQTRVQGWDPYTGEERTGLAGDDPAIHRSLLGRTVASDGEAEALAQTNRHYHAAAGHTFWGVATGDTTLAPGLAIRPRGLAADHAGRYVLTAVVHTIDTTHGYLCELDSRPERPEPEGATWLSGLVLGEVCDVDDPAERGRVQVNLTSFSEAVTHWLLVLQAGAGDGKGLVALPEVGDQVLVGLPGDDPAQGVVLGSVYGEDGPAWGDAAAQPGDTQRPYILTTRNGQRVQLDDSEGSVRLANAEGSYLALTPDGVTLHAAGQLVIEAPGQRLTLGGDRIDMEQR
jgi:phage baseplate assembly protein gpV